MIDVAVVLATYERRARLERCIESVRRAVGECTYKIIVVDGGSRDGSPAWLAAQPDVILCAGDLSGAVPNFNLGFALAVGTEAPAVGILNDDLEVLGPPPAIEVACDLLKRSPAIGAVALNSDRYVPYTSVGGGRFEQYYGRVYVNQGVVRREAGMAVARLQGDPTGRAWWHRDHKGYIADTEFGLGLHRLGWHVHPAYNLRVHDTWGTDGGSEDPLRAHNLRLCNDPIFFQRFKARWPDAASTNYSREDALRYGGPVYDDAGCGP